MTNEQLIKAYRKGDKTALEKLILQNKGLVYKLANYYAPVYKEGDIEDLAQEGYAGLVRAVQTYSPRKGKFTTYAFFWIRQAMLKAINKQQDTVSLDEPIDDGEGNQTTLGDVLADDANFIDELENRLTLESLWYEIRKELPPLQFKVFVLWVYGYSLAHIAGRLGITLQEVKNLKQRALRTVAFRSYKVRKLAKEWLECRTPDYYTTSRIFDGVGYHTSYKKDSIVERIVIARDETVARLVE